VKLIQARGLNVASTLSRPYVVVQFEQNEFVSRNNTDETEREIKGTATTLATATAVPVAPSSNSSSALSALGAIGSKDAALRASSSRKASPNVSPASSVSSGKSIGPSSSSSAAAAQGVAPLLGQGRLSAHNPVWKHQVSFDVTSEDSLVSFNVYDRSTEDQGFLGTFQLKPVLVHDHTVDQWYKLKPYNQEVVSGEMRVQITFEQYKTKRALTPRDFEFLKLIGRGTFGKVFQVRKKDTRRIYAMKVLSKKEIVAKKEVAHTIGERHILQRSLDSPFLVGLKFSFQTDADLYLVTDFKSGGELFWHLQRETRFSEERARFYIAELVLALEHLHKYNIVYRDLKPENILLDATGHVALCDFGLSKANLRSDELTTTFCGTTEYLAPEILLDEQGYNKIVDFWSLGVLLFEMCCGWSPFYAEDTQQMYKNICFGKIRFPKGVINDDGKQFVKGLLNRNPKHRLGAVRDAAELKEHAFFSCIDWKALALKQVTPPFKPVVESDESTDNFDKEFTNADIRDFGIFSDTDNEDGLDDEDPSGDWVSQSLSSPGLAYHTPNGPLGYDKSPPIPQPGQQNGRNTGDYIGNGPLGSSSKPQGIDIKPKKTKRKDANGPSGSPLTNSVQENFRGFTYSGESVIAGSGFHQRNGRTSRGASGDEDAVDDADMPEVTTEDEAEDHTRSAGRYANARRKGLTMTSIDQDL
jgi:serine/threonine protein kinase